MKAISPSGQQQNQVTMQEQTIALTMDGLGCSICWTTTVGLGDSVYWTYGAPGSMGTERGCPGCGCPVTTWGGTPS